jgi:hypothetical protein
MTNEPLQTEYERPDDELLNRLVRAAAQQDRDEVTWPRPESVLAYIGGNETDAQRQEIQDTLALSAAFRRFLVDNAADVETVTAPDAIEAYNAVPVPRHLRSHQQDATDSVAERLGRWLS